MKQLNPFLTFDTATEALTVAVKNNDKICYQSVIAPKKHAELLLPAIDLCMKEANLSFDELKGIFVGEGPGSFTGIRMALSVAQGLSMTSGVKVWQVSTLMLNALSGVSCHDKTKNYVVAIDARMGQVYAQAYQFINNKLMPQTPPILEKLDSVLNQLLSFLNHEKVIGIGNGFKNYESQLEIYKHSFLDIRPDIYPDAVHYAPHLCQYPKVYATCIDDFTSVKPIYIRDQVADVSAKNIDSSKDK